MKSNKNKILHEWLRLKVKDGFDRNVANDLLDRQDWEAISKLKDKSDWYTSHPDAPTETDEIRASEEL